MGLAEPHLEWVFFVLEAVILLLLWTLCTPENAKKKNKTGSSFLIFITQVTRSKGTWSVGNSLSLTHTHTHVLRVIELAKEHCWTCSGACETCQESTQGLSLNVAGREHHRCFTGWPSTQEQEVRSTYRDPEEKLPLPAGSFPSSLQTKLNIVPAGNEKCLQGRCPELPSESMKGEFVVQRQ